MLLPPSRDNPLPEFVKVMSLPLSLSLDKNIEFSVILVFEVLDWNRTVYSLSFPPEPFYSTMHVKYVCGGVV